MSTTIDPLRLRAVLGRKQWCVPREFGADGWYTESVEANAGVIVSCAQHDGVEWVHASIAHPDRLPDYNELKLLHRAAFGDGYAYLVFPPTAQHVNLHQYAIHLWGRADGKPMLPEFARDIGLGVPSI